MGAKLTGATVKDVKDSNQGFAFLLAALTLLTGLLTALGIANGALPNMVRNHPNWTLAAFGGAIFAILLGALGSYVFTSENVQRVILAFGIFCIGVGLICGLYAAVQNWKDQPQPDLQASIRGSTMLVVHMTDSHLLARQHVTVRVLPLYYVRSTHDVSPGRPIYQANVGPNADGDASLDARVQLPPGTYTEIGVKAWVGDEPTDCFNTGHASGCLTELVGRRAVRPSLRYQWRFVGSSATPLLIVMVTGRDIVATRSLDVVVRRAHRAGKPLAEAFVPPDEAGDYATTLRVPIAPRVRAVCVAASTIRHPRMLCRHNRTGVQWEVISVPRRSG